jgi:hypothetical protein
MIFDRWVSAVFKLIPKRMLVSLLLLPSAINQTISNSRAITPVVDRYADMLTRQKICEIHYTVVMKSADFSHPIVLISELWYSMFFWRGSRRRRERVQLDNAA